MKKSTEKTYLMKLPPNGLGRWEFTELLHLCAHFSIFILQGKVLNWAKDSEKEGQEGKEGGSGKRTKRIRRK